MFERDRKIQTSAFTSLSASEINMLILVGTAKRTGWLDKAENKFSIKPVQNSLTFFCFFFPGPTCHIHSGRVCSWLSKAHKLMQQQICFKWTALLSMLIID